MGLFFAYKDELTKGCGYEHFSKEHLIWIAITFGMVFVIANLCRMLRKRINGVQKCNVILGILATTALALEIGKLYIAVRAGADITKNLPLHLCSLSMFVNPIYLMVRNSRFGKYFAEITVALLLPGEIIGVIIPNWNSYPGFSYMNGVGFLTHGIGIAFSVCLIIIGFMPTIKNFKAVPAFVFVVLEAIFVYDITYKHNYAFLSHGPKGTPLQKIEAVIGRDYYRMLYPMALITLAFVMHFVIKGIALLRRRSLIAIDNNVVTSGVHSVRESGASIAVEA